MSEFLKQFQDALNATANKMDNGNLPKGAADALANLGNAANVTARAAAGMLLAKGLNDQAGMLQQIATDIQIPAPPKKEDNIRTVDEVPEQLAHQKSPEPPEGTTVDDEWIREVLRRNPSLKAYFTASSIDQQGTYDFMKIPSLLLDQLMAHYRGKTRGPGATDEEKVVYIFLEGVNKHRPSPLKAVAWNEYHHPRGAHHVRPFFWLI